MKRFIFMVMVTALLGASLPTYAQLQSGTIYGTIRDEQGGVLPGVTLTLKGSDRTLTMTTESDGEYRFLYLPPGPYTLTATLSGFKTLVREEIFVVVGQNVELPITMQIAAVEESVTVTGQSPVIDVTQTGTNTNLTLDELTRIPTSRDPWAILRSVPGLMVDRVNIAGNETGQQSNFQSKGTRPADAVWTMDGVVITDMAAIGASPTYFNFDNFEEIQISTTGQDIRQSTGGVGINLISKRGTNQFSGGGRGYFTGEGLEASNVPKELKVTGPTGQRPVTASTADHNKQISDYGFDLGGPILRDKAWFYASWSNQDIRLVRASGNIVDRTALKTSQVKGNWQVTQKDMVNVLWFLGAKEKEGRSPGDAGIVENVPTATWNQGNAFPEDRPHGLLKFEYNRNFTSDLFLGGRYAYYGTGFVLDPVGGLGVEAGQSRRLGRSFGSTRRSLNVRPQHTADLEGDYFSNAFDASHDLKFGGGYRRTDALTGTLWPGNMMLALDFSATDQRARVYREGRGTNRTEYFHLYVGDTISRDRLTVNLGLRYDRQWGGAQPSDTLSNKAFPNLVPGIKFAGYEAPFKWNNFSPRAGVTYALDDVGKTILRASFNRYAGQLQTGYVGYENPSGSVGFVEYPWVDLNGDNLAQPNEVNTSVRLAFGGGFNPDNPTAVTSANRINPDLKAPVTLSVVAGADRELRPDLALQANYSYTRTDDWVYFPWRGVTPADYIAQAPITGEIPTLGSSYNIVTFRPDPAKVAAGGNGRFLTNHPSYYSYYHGVEAAVVKRMSNNWMMRLGAAYNLARENYGDLKVNFDGNPTRLDVDALVAGGAFAPRSSGSGFGDIFIHGKWQLNVNGVYAFPYDIELAANLFGRQGYPYPVYRDVDLGRDGSNRVLVSPEVDTFRFDNVWDLDLRVAKRVRADQVNVQVIGDLFNVFNSNPHLVRNRNVASPNFRYLTQSLSPLILRIGLLVGF